MPLNNNIYVTDGTSGSASVDNDKSAHVHGDPNSLNFDMYSEDIAPIVKANTIYDRYRENWLNKFSRFGILDPFNTLTHTKEYLFITKPDLPLFNTSGTDINPTLKDNAFFVDAIARYANIAKQLQVSLTPNQPFMTILSNTVTSPLDIPGLSAESIDTGANINGTTISYRGTSIKSDEDHDFNLEFEDNKYLDVYMLFKMYDEFERLKWRGIIDYEKTGSTWKNYVLNKVLYDQVAIYKIIVADDGYRIIHFSRVVGCYPISIPRDAFSDMSDVTPQKLTVGWKGKFFRDTDPVIIAHFNQLVGYKRTNFSNYALANELPLFNETNHAMEGSWASKPVIDTLLVNDPVKGPNHREYFLRWLA